MKLLKFILLLIFIIFPFGQILRFRLPFFPPSVKFQPLDLAAGMFVSVWFFVKRNPIKSPWFFKPLATFGLIGIFSLFIKTGVYGFTDMLAAAFYLIRFWIYTLFGLALYSFLENTDKKNIFKFGLNPPSRKSPIVKLGDSEKLFRFGRISALTKRIIEIPRLSGRVSLKKLLLFEGIIISIASLLQYFILPDTRFLYDFGWDRHFYRSIGTFLDPSFNGLILVLSFIVWMNLFSQKNKHLYLFVVGGILIVLAIALCFSRAIYFIFILTVFLFYLKNLSKKFITIIFLVFLFISAIWLSPKPGGEGVNLLRTSSLFLKIDNYSQTIKIIKDNFLFGVGFNAFRIVQKNYGFIGQRGWEITNAGGGADNSFLFVFATTGIVGFSVFLYFWINIFKKSLKEKNKLVFLSLLGITVASFSFNAVFYPWVLLWLIILLVDQAISCKLV